ncbi:glycosyltransferase family 4 protein [Flavobacterium urocaniciphilum]|uniref:Glycosyltransferase involved in cell wall bisynthesis n=1 Tax=Flavobacterium urocaniciphilum TaxID=1299341 RepID=A0A1H9BRH1_9FLAO|nr:glycosyltransferase family 1 protein [Flavobacterium urocaniciphilum]SEP91489.1 Glycosyltransferase involved in cell wall bisynthesis [Flavobacterium urocaniciphilum]
MDNHKLKVFVDCHVFDGGFQGTRTYIQGLYLELIKDKNIVFYFAANDVNNLKSIFGEQENIVFLKYSFKNKFLRLLFDIPFLILKNKIDFAHFQYIVSPIKLCKYIVTTHDVLFIDFPNYFSKLSRIKNTFLYKHGAKCADIRLTVSEYSKNQIAQHFNIHNYHITPNAVDDVFYETYNKSEIQKTVSEKYNLTNYIIYISRWEPRKNQQLLLKSFVDLKLYNEYQLLFIGDSTLYNYEFFDVYNNLDEKIKSKIIKMDKTDFETMLLLLRGAKVSVYPSIAEGFGIPPLESIAAGIPTICSNQTAMSDFTFLKKYEFNPFNEVEFKEKLISILNTDFSKDFTDISQKIKANYCWKKSANELKKLITDF